MSDHTNNVILVSNEPVTEGSHSELAYPRFSGISIN